MYTDAAILCCVVARLSSTVVVAAPIAEQHNEALPQYEVPACCPIYDDG